MAGKGSKLPERTETARIKRKCPRRRLKLSIKKRKKQRLTQIRMKLCSRWKAETDQGDRGKTGECVLPSLAREDPEKPDLR